MITVCFFVDGIPIPKGSTRSFVVAGRAVTTAANKKTKPWEIAIRSAAQANFYCPSAAPVEVEVEFILPRPKSVSSETRPLPTVKPDLDKLLRCVLDALTGVAYVDDAQVTRVAARKAYADNLTPGAAITVMGRTLGQILK
jgi:crossover junction endodeoxyribonuclease RusA